MADWGQSSVLFFLIPKRNFGFTENFIHSVVKVGNNKFRQIQIGAQQKNSLELRLAQIKELSNLQLMFSGLQLQMHNK